MNKKTSLAKVADQLWKLACRKKWGLTCECCGKPAITFHHFIPKSRNGLLKFEVKNGIPICRDCHYTIHFSSNPAEIHRLIEKIRKGRGKDWCDWIDKHEKIHGISFNTIKWLELEIIKLKEYLNVG